MSLIKSIKEEISDTAEHFKNLGRVAKAKGVTDALKYDLLVTYIRNYSDSDFLADQEKTRKMRAVPAFVARDILTGKETILVEERNVTNVENYVLWQFYR